VVLNRGRYAQLAVGHEGLDRELLADQALLQDDPLVVGLTDVRFGLLLGDLVTDHPDALAAGEAGGLDDEVAVGRVDVLAGGLGVVEGLEVRTPRDVVFRHEASLEGLVRLDAGLVLLRTKSVDADVVERVGDAGLEGRFGTDDRQRGVDVGCVGADRGGVRRLQFLEALGEAGDAGIPVAGAGVQRRVRLGDRAGDGVFPTATAHQQHGLSHTGNPTSRDPKYCASIASPPGDRSDRTRPTGPLCLLGVGHAMSAPTERNRLDEEESPYLRQHADNPVNWQPWDETAREAARERDVPIFLSIGYAACHWCHVMAEESFEHEAIARRLNDWFVPVKVDREERPDVDRVYQTICQQVTGRGGWPLSVWLTPDGRPFYVGTYFPPEPRRNTPGFGQLLEDVHDAWTDADGRDEIESRADEWRDAIEDEVAGGPTGDTVTEADDGDRLLESAAESAVRGADREHGGWGRSQKFPQPGRLHLLLRAHAATDREPFREVALETLDAMADGGMYDHLGGGFHRYATDREWTVPHFEKMLYDNAEIPRAYLAGYQVTGDERYATVVRETIDFLQRELQHPEGGFYSTLDAQSEGEEGRFYVWRPADVDDAIEDDRDAELFRERFGVTQAGNFEGKTVLTVARGLDDLAEEFDLAENEVRDRLDRAREQALAAREHRERPARDEKILAGWNGLAVSLLAEAAIVLDADYAGLGADALAFVQDHCWDTDAGRLQRRYADGVVKIDGYLEDYAFLGRGAFDLYQATGDVDHLAFALDLAQSIADRFWDEDDDALYFTPGGGEDLVARPQEVTDQSTPASAGVAADLLSQLDHFVSHDRFGSIAERAIDAQRARIHANSLQHVSLALAADRRRRGDLELTLVADEHPAAWLSTLREQYLPRRLLAWRPADEDRFAAWLDHLDQSDPPAIWAEREARDGEPTVYACRSFTCSPPHHDLAAALEWASDTLETNRTGDDADAPF